MLCEHPGVAVEAAVHTGFPVTLVCQYIVLESCLTCLSVSDPVSTLIVHITLSSVGEVTLRARTLIVGDFTSSIDQVFLNTDTKIPVRSSYVHKSGEGISFGHVLQL